MKVMVIKNELSCLKDGIDGSFFEMAGDLNK